MADGSNGTRKLGNFNLTAADQILMASASGTTLNAGVELVGGFEGASAALLRWRDDPTQNKLYLSNGDGTFRTSTSFNLNTAARALSHSDGKTDMLVADFTGSGHTEILRLKDTPTTASESTGNQLYVRTYKGPPADTLTRVTTSTGAVTTLTYTSLMQPEVYTSDATDTTYRAAYPTYDLNTPMQVVSQLSTDSGVNQAGVPVTQQTRYAYRGLKGSFGGRGLLGFRESRQQTTAPNGEPLTIVTSHVQEHPYIGNVGLTRTLRGDLAQTQATEISRTESIYCDPAAATAAAIAAATALAPCKLPAGTKIARPYLYKAIESGRDLDGTLLPTVTTTNSFNGRGDLERAVTETRGTAVGLVQTFTKTNVNEYEPDKTSGDQWILGRLKRSTVRSQAPQSLPSMATSAGTAPTASDRIGTGPLPPLDPAVLNVILQLLLDD